MTADAPRPRFEALDVLRGLAILGMALSGMVPYFTLPAWMYHAQLPPPTRDFNANVFGLTWVDLVFPMFLFSMGAAIPLALDRRLKAGDSKSMILKGLLGRGLMLAVYALIGQHLRPFVLSDAPGMGEWLISLVGFGLIGMIMLRWPQDVPVKYRHAGTVFAWVAAAFITGFWNYPDDTQGFGNYRNDVILMVLANVAVSGGAIWLWTRFHPGWRWVIFAAMVAIFLTSDLPGLSRVVWNWDPTNYLPFKSGPYGRFLPIFYHFEYHKYLLIVLPGTFVGDLIRELDLSKVQFAELVAPRRLRALNRAVVLWFGPLAVAVACIGLTARAVVPTTLVLTGLVAFAVWVGSETDDPIEALAHRLLLFSAPLLVVGLLSEPLGGGIRKDSATISYFLVTSALSCIMLASLAMASASVASSKTWRVIRDTGTNPILGYLVITNLVWGIVGVTWAEDGVNALTQNPWLLTGWALVKTVFVAVITAWFTRRRLFFRA